MHILGIDPGLTATGWGVVEREGNSLRYRDCGTIKVPQTLPLSARLAHLLERLSRVVSLCSPDEVALESVFLGKNPRSAFALGQARAVALLAAVGRPCTEYAPRTVKRAVSASGASDKRQVRFMVARLLPEGREAMDEASDHAIDALAVAVCHALQPASKNLVETSIIQAEARTPTPEDMNEDMSEDLA